jgi:hypothetical protein
MSRTLIGSVLGVTLAVAASPEFEVASIEAVSSSIPAPGRLTSIQIVTSTAPRSY